MRRAAAVRARQRKLREENANQEAESLLESEVSAPAAATKGGRNRKGGVSRQKETNSESEDQGVENKEGHSVNGDSSEEQYEVEKIVDMKVIRGVRKYRIRWKGYDSESDTWETADNLNCPNALQEYLNQNSKSEDVSVTSGRKRASKADVVAEEAATNNIQNTEKDTSSKDEGEDMPPAKKRKSSKVAKPTKNDESADDEKEEEEEKTVEPPVKKRKSKIEKPAKTDNESADDEDEEEENEEKTVEPPAKKRKSRVSKPAKSDDESADDENEEPPAKNRKLSRVSKPAKSDDESANDENEEEQKTVEEPPAKEKTAKIGRTKAKGKKEETVSSEDTENGVNTDETSYEVEKIMEVHHKKNGKKEYLIHWRGYPHSQDTWEPEENLDCEELIREFEERVNKLKLTPSGKMVEFHELQTPGWAKNLSVRELRTERVHTNRYAEEQSAKRHSKRGKGKKRTTYYDTE